jgi:methyl-accepting chemotaxis protein
MSFAEPVGNDVIGADVELGDVIQEILGVKIGESGYAALIDGNGDFLVHPNPAKVGQPLREGSRLTKSPTEIEIDNKDWIGAAFPIDGVDWKLLLIMEKSDALSGLGEIAITNLLVSAVTISIVVLVCGFMISKLLAPLTHLNQAMSDISKGDADLTKRLSIKSDDEIGLLSHSFNNFVSVIHEVVSESLSSSRLLTSLSTSAKTSAQQNNTAIQVQQSEISQVAAAINEMSVTSSQVADNASDTASAAEMASQEGGRGMQIAKENKQHMESLTTQIDQTTDTINQLDSQAQQINTILSTIQGIAEQTNLLALNAAIEAARAGEQGRGFAVVADEVRALSGRTHQATEEIQIVMKELQEQTQNAVSIMGASKELTAKTGDSAGELTNNLMHIAEAVEDISVRASTIANASREQYTSTEELNRIATAIHDASNQLADNVHQTTEQSDELHTLSNDLDNNLSRFRI